MKVKSNFNQGQRRTKLAPDGSFLRKNEDNSTGQRVSLRGVISAETSAGSNINRVTESTKPDEN